MDKQLHIGVDARPLSMPLTGIGQYTFQLLKILTQLGHRWTLYSHKPLLVSFTNQENIQYRTGDKNSCMMGAVWSQTMLPYLISQDQLDVFWSPRHHLPLLGNKKLPMVLTIHDIVYKLFSETVKRGNYFLESQLLPRSVKRANQIITVSETSKQDLITHLHTPAEKIKVIYPGLTEQAESALARTSLVSIGIEKPYILFLGTLEPRKNLSRLIEAYAQLPENLRNQYQLVLAGGHGWGDEDLPGLVTKLQLTGKVIMPGFISEQVRCTLLTHASLFTMPSLYEGFGSPVIEAMAAGIPVLTSSKGATAEVAQDAGILVDPYDTDQIKSGIEHLFSDDILRQQLIQQGIKRAKNFTWQSTAEKTLAIITKSI